MEHQNRLKALADDELLAGLSNVVGRRRQITAEFLAYLAELDERQLFLDLGYPSIFAYCVEALGVCESSAGRHIAAARVCRDHAHAFELVARGELHASALSLMKKHVTAENAAELFELCTRKSARQIEVLLAARFPRPDVRDLIRRLPVTVQSTPDVGSEARRVEPLSADRYGVHFTADGEFLDLLERVRGLAGHRLPSGDLLILLKLGLVAYERELEKERFAVGRKPRSSKSAIRPSTEPVVSASPMDPQSDAVDPVARDSDAVQTRRRVVRRRTRHCSAAVAREVFTRDGKQCSYVSADARRCSSRLRLELDHIQPWALGGEDGAVNLRLRCRAHNQRYARQCFGELHQRAAVARKRQQSAPPPP